MRLDDGILEFTVGEPSPLKIEVFDANGSLLKKEALPEAQPGVHHLDIAPSRHSREMLIVKASIGSLVQTFRFLPSQEGRNGKNGAIAGSKSAGGKLAKRVASGDTLKISAAGFGTEMIGIASLDTTVHATLLKAGVPKVTARNSLLIPASYGNAVSNAGKLTTNVTYPVYWYAANAPSSEAFRSTPGISRQSTPKTKFCNVYTPPGYDPNLQYPLIIIMHGITDNPNTWIERANPKIQPFFDNLIASKEARPFIAVFAAGTVDNAQGGYYAFGAELKYDLLPFIESKYSVRKDRASRAMTGFSFGGMQTVNIGLCAHLKQIAWFAGLHAAGGAANATTIAEHVARQEPEKYPLHYFYMMVGTNDGTSKGNVASSTNGLTSKGPHITEANFSSQTNVVGPGSSNGQHLYPVAQIGLYNFLRMAFSPEY
jgi:hypothetical protein